MNLSREFLRKIVQEQYETILRKPLGIQREIMAQLEIKLKSNHIYVITGIRRCGKSTLLRQIMHTFYHDQNFYYLNFDDERLTGFTADDFDRMYEVLIEHFGNYDVFFFDEIQNVKDFERFIRRLHDMEKKVFITGSNATLLGSEIATKLTGRHLDLELFPFSFREFLKFYAKEITNSDIYSAVGRSAIIKQFDQYCKDGGMPEYLQVHDNEILMRIYEDILIKDIAVRNNLTSIKQLKDLARYLFSNVGSKINYSKLSQFVQIKSPNTVKSYMEQIQIAYLGFMIPKLEYSVKKQIISDRKFYAIDTGMIEKVSTKISEDKGWILENMVYMELRRRFIDSIIYYDKTDESECDFAIMNRHTVHTAIQVTYFLSDQNRTRELAGIESVLKRYNLNEGWILTYDQEEEINLIKYIIHVIPVWKWLLKS